ncbi:hypothetical protein RRG08_066531 [Elysia crispata]|uniref:Uncharacterized protein n=1 Tax=Elysia crispata TaxID=231223 RepID=A0AAE0ZLR0_9GAST|nr:hypothetical protein RRG08_066531 [Elysia crispata]
MKQAEHDSAVTQANVRFASTEGRPCLCFLGFLGVMESRELDAMLSSNTREEICKLVQAGFASKHCERVIAQLVEPWSAMRTSCDQVLACIFCQFLPWLSKEAHRSPWWGVMCSLKEEIVTAGY